MNDAEHKPENCLSARAQTQRERILCAAQQCFNRSGFHAASMSAICAAARMSPGLIYRYFASKNAIIQAIIARQLEEAAKILEQLHSPEDFSAALLQTFEHWRRGDREDRNAALFLDVTAAAARDPEIAAMVRAANAELSRQLGELLRRCGEREGFTLDQNEIQGRTMLLQTLICGLAAQSIRDPAVPSGTVEQPLSTVVSKLMRP